MSGCVSSHIFSVLKQNSFDNKFGLLLFLYYYLPNTLSHPMPAVSLRIKKKKGIWIRALFSFKFFFGKSLNTSLVIHIHPLLISDPRHNTQSVQISQKQDVRNIHAIMKTMCPPGYQHNDFVATHALGHMMYGLWW